MLVRTKKIIRLFAAFGSISVIVFLGLLSLNNKDVFNSFYQENMAQIFTQNDVPFHYTRSIGEFEYQDKKIALVVGNSDYRQVPRLRNPLYDAKAISKSLRKLGFEVLYYEDLTRVKMEEAIRHFSQKITPDSVALFYYAGHGVQLTGSNFIVPIDARMKKISSVDFDVIGLNSIVNQMENSPSRLNILIIDACRDNPWRDLIISKAKTDYEPFYQNRSMVSRSLSRASGTLIAYATAENHLAADGRGNHSPYTESLLKWLEVPNLEIGQLFRYVREEVRKKTKGGQTPWESGSLTGEFYFSKDQNFNIADSRLSNQNNTPAPTQGEFQATRASAISAINQASRIRHQVPVSGSGSSSILKRPLREKERKALEEQEAAQKKQEEDAYWEATQKIATPDVKKVALETYLKEYPEGKYVALAQLQIQDIEANPQGASSGGNGDKGADGGNGDKAGSGEKAGEGGDSSKGSSSGQKSGSSSKNQTKEPLDFDKLKKIEKKLPLDLKVQIQEALGILGFYKGAITGKFGPKTYGAIVAFQKQKKFDPTGYLTPKQLVVLFADSSTKIKKNPNLVKKLNRENTPSWYLAATPEGKLAYVFGIKGDPEDTKISGDDVIKKFPETTDEGGISLIVAAKKAEEGAEGAMKTVLARPDLKPFATRPPPAPGPAGTVPQRVSFNAIIYENPAKYEKEIGYVVPGSWVRVSGEVTGADWLQLTAPDGTIGYIETFALSAKPTRIHDKPLHLFAR